MTTGSLIKLLEGFPEDTIIQGITDGKLYEMLALLELPSEEWRDVPGYEGKYSVSNLGRVKSFLQKRTGRILPGYDQEGY